MNTAKKVLGMIPSRDEKPGGSDEDPWVVIPDGEPELGSNTYLVNGSLMVRSTTSLNKSLILSVLEEMTELYQGSLRGRSIYLSILISLLNSIGAATSGSGGFVWTSAINKAVNFNMMTPLDPSMKLGPAEIVGSWKSGDLDVHVEFRASLASPGTRRALTLDAALHGSRRVDKSYIKVMAAALGLKIRRINHHWCIC